MRKLLGIVIAIVTVAGCKSNGNRTTGADGIAFDSIVIDSTFRLGGTPDAPACEVSLSLLYAKGEKADIINDTLLRSGILIPEYFSLSGEHLSFKAAADSFTSTYIADYRRDYGALYREDKQHAASYNCRYVVRTQTQVSGDNVLNYIASVSTYGGGAYPVMQTIAKNFDLKTGRLIRLTNVFVPGYEEPLKDMIEEAACKKFKMKDLEELKKAYIFADGNVYVPDNFIMTENEITFIYCEDEVAPHAVGEIRLTFEKDQLSKILK